jgi:hypothetical protein
MFMNQSLGVKTRRESLMARSVTRYRTANIDGLKTTNNRLLSLLGREQANEEFMRAILLKGFGGLDSLVIETLPIPSRKQATPSSR